MSSTDRLACALAKIDHANSADPETELYHGQPQAKALVYSQHMTRWLHTLVAQPSELMQIACRAQHIKRWTIPRSDYPEGREAYYRWRKACGQMHGQETAAIMGLCGYSVHECEHVAMLLTKRNLRQDTDTQLLEDVACLVFLEQYFADFYTENPDYDQAKWQRIVGRTWQKMSPRGQQAAEKLVVSLPLHLQTLLKITLSEIS